MVIPVEARNKPTDYTIEVADNEVYSFNALENKLENTLALSLARYDEVNQKYDEVNQKYEETLARSEEATQKYEETLDGLESVRDYVALAQGHAENAQTSAANASASATNASASATNASNSATAAGTAQTKAEAARSGAETAKDQAYEYLEVTEDAMTEAVNAKNTIEKLVADYGQIRPAYAESVADMTDTSLLYLNAATNTLWAYQNTVAEQEVTRTDQIIGTTDNPYTVGRLSSSGSVSTDVQSHIVTPYIDLTKAEYQGKTIQIHLEGNRYASESSETYIQTGVYKPDKSVILPRGFTAFGADTLLGEFDGTAKMQLEVLGDTSATLTFPVPLVHDGGATTGYLRFCGLGTVRDSVYITYPSIETVSGYQWVDTGISIAPTVSEADKMEIAEKTATLIDTQLLPLIGNGEVSV
jgi:hypothetical protein